MPTIGKDNEYLECLGELAAFIADNCGAGSAILIGMDSNCSDKSTKRRPDSLNQFCENHNLVKVMPPSPTFHHVNGVYSSKIDSSYHITILSVLEMSLVMIVATTCTTCPCWPWLD